MGGWNRFGWRFQGQGTEGKRLWTGGGGGGEVKRLSAAHSRSALDPVKESPSPSPKRSSSSLELVVAFCFFRYRFRF